MSRAPIDDGDVAVVPPAPGDVEMLVAERASRAYGGHYRSMTLAGGFGIAALRAAAAAELDHEPFPLVRRVQR